MGIEKIKINPGQMNLLIMGVEHGFREAERGKNLQETLLSVYELYEIEKPKQDGY